MLSEHNVSRGVATLYFDGVISSKSSNKRFYVEKVPFTHCSVGNMDVADDSVDGAIWIQSTLLAADGAWYLLKNPSPEYERFWTPYLWLANFAKYVVDFLSAHESVRLADFESRFARWVRHAHNSEKVEAWFAQGLKSVVMDFRQHFATNVEYLWKEACNITGEKLDKHPIWEETHPEMLNAIKAGKHDIDPRTVVTPGMFECFKNLFPDEMRVLKKRRNRVTGDLDTESEPTRQKDEAQLDGKIRDAPDFGIKVGDVVVVEPEKIDGKVGWKSERPFWSAYVNEVVGEQRDKLRLTWLYCPEDTTIGDAYYPNPCELFFSDHCMCDTPKHQLFPVEEVLGKLSVDFKGQEQHGGHEYYVRQKYEWYEKRDEWCFRTLKQSELRECPCLSSAAQHKTSAAVFEDIVARYSVGDCVYFDPGHDSESEGGLWPKRIVRIDLDDQTVSLQSFWPTGRDNELYVDTDDARIIFGSHLRRIGRKCTVERVGENEELPPAQQQHGAGDYWFYRYAFDSETREVTSICDSDCHDPLVKEVKKRKKSVQPLCGLDLFCGGGSFAHGIEDAGGVEHKWAVDYDTTAMHTYRANVTDERHEGRDVFFWEGSVNTFISAAMTKAGEPGVPQPGDVDFVVAGSPCQGFSTANRHKTTARSRTNCSLVASVASFVDFYRPKYALLENVVAMKSDYKRDDGTTYNVCNQMVAACVSMGYQLRLYVLGAYLHGAPQKRERIFISLAASGLTLPGRPAPTHAANKTRVRISSKDGSGHQFRDGGDVGATPFAFRSSSNALDDLPDIGDAQVGVNPQYPHHVTSVSLSKKTRQLVALIPKSHRKVRGKNWSKSAASYSAAVALNRIPHCLRSAYLERHRLKHGAIGSYCRFDPRGLIPTILTQPGTQSISASPNLHYDQNRVMTIEEARRAQGFLERDVILGTKEKAWKIVGNAVSRPVALALGVSLRNALEENAKLDADA
ncbi:S-adenosyl-L-methionine-dependent methyltransferase [Saitoella complicata NRRL Y-17804]|uniref:S-adenosyl-L-methionine-dependent methyltransferase n=1 Tax=Saitoella complicata (strain BCRC 22490 / CBS 7301 / JCM 7358 / NBRC 10748 / NRRL Y-17804) TaxID=698492 RepID=UPI0008681E43|nr:S-adenosyl-L-methionine-dependent methyltransferase [Saitoella complicata NRRL Y-17804]ODQ51258.1 S-adenosyl-L-methionine-dependent methyltransferase [Saitoella complicata NRRL Y-17804]